MYSLRNRHEKLAEDSLFCLFLKLVQINFIFTDNVRILYIYLLNIDIKLYFCDGTLKYIRSLLKKHLVSGLVQIPYQFKNLVNCHSPIFSHDLCRWATSVHNKNSFFNGYITLYSQPCPFVYFVSPLLA